MDDQDTGQGPSPADVAPVKEVKRRQKPAERWRNGPMIREVYDHMERVYLAGNRTPQQLARVCRVSHRTARKAIREGWPQHNWPPLMERASVHDRRRQEAVDKADPEKAKQARDFLAMREELFKILFGIRSAAAQILSKVLPEIAGAPVVGTRPVRRVVFEEVLGPDGKVARRVPRTITVDEVVAPSVVDLADIVAKMAAALDRVGGTELDQLTAKTPPPARRNPLASLSVAQLEFMGKTGQVPDGVSFDDLGDA